MWKYRGQQRPPFAVQPKAGQESVWDYPRPPIVFNCNRAVNVMHNDMVIASSVETYRVLETASPPTFYIPEKDIDWSHLVASLEQSFCEWKGEASYWELNVNPDGKPVAWQYNDPFPAFGMLRGHTAFYPGRIACYVDGERVRSQHGEFYGGWVTNEIVGPFKGDPDSGYW